MKVIQLHNLYAGPVSGENIMVMRTAELLRRSGIDVELVTRDSNPLMHNPFRTALAFASGIYSFSAARAMRKRLRSAPPDLVHVHNIYPLFSPSVLRACRSAGIPVVMSCHNYRLLCPAGMQFRQGRICDLCLGGKEYWCVLKNCKGNLPQSLGYALRTFAHRKTRIIRNNVSLFLTPSYFLRDHLIRHGFPAERMLVVPNMVAVPKKPVDSAAGGYIAFAGRFNPQKGVETLLSAIHRLQLPAHLAGDCMTMRRLTADASDQVKFLGPLDQAGMNALYQNARMVIVPSRAMETFGLTAVEAMSYGLPVIGSNIGGLPEVIDEGRTGYLVEPDNVEALAARIQELWNNPLLGRQLGLAGREKVLREYTEDMYLQRLLAAYRRVLEKEIP
ncbi:MAG: glycosyltransferase family 4 protein [bacterium]